MNESRKTLMDAVRANEELKEKLLELQREVQTVGMPKAEFEERQLSILKEFHLDFTAEELEKALHTEEMEEISTDELEDIAAGGGCSHVAGGVCYGYDKKCPEHGVVCERYCPD